METNLDPKRESLRRKLKHRNSYWDTGAGYTVTPDDLQHTGTQPYTGGGTTTGFDGSTSSITAVGSIIGDDPVFVSPGTVDTLVSGGYVDGTDAQWIMSAGELHLTSGLQFTKRPDGLYNWSNDGRPQLAALCEKRQGPGKLCKWVTCCPTTSARYMTKDTNRESHPGQTPTWSKSARQKTPDTEHLRTTTSTSRSER